MDLAPALTRYAHVLGRWQVARRFASPELKRAVALAQVSSVWDVFLRDAGPGEVGPAHEDVIGNTGITCTHDDRRDGVLLWLSENGATAIAEGAVLLSRAAGAVRRFGPDD